MFALKKRSVGRLLECQFYTFSPLKQFSSIHCARKSRLAVWPVMANSKYSLLMTEQDRDAAPAVCTRMRMN